MMLYAFCLYFVVAATEPAASDAPAQDTATDSSSVTAESLRQQIKTMRRNVLLGGDQVSRAEREAVTFYNGKVQKVDQRHDTLQADLSEQRASYNLALKRSLSEKDAPTRHRSIQEADSLRKQITSIESELDQLAKKRSNLTQLIWTVQSRQREERQDVMAQLETSDDFQQELGLPLAGIGLAPQVQNTANTSPFDNPDLIKDLLQRDPIGARRVLFEADPQRYFQTFPLRPPTEILIKALPYPLPDLPGQR